MSISIQANEAYEINVVISENKPSGKGWDLNSDPPDIFVVVNGIERFKCKNRFKCRSYFKSDFHEETFTIDIYDKDPVINDFVGSGSCGVDRWCEVGSSDLLIRKHLPKHHFGTCDADLATDYMEREYITFLKWYGAVRDYGFEIDECSFNSKSNHLTIRSKNWFIGSNFLNYYTFESMLVIGSGGGGPEVLTNESR